MNPNPDMTGYPTYTQNPYLDKNHLKSYNQYF